MAEPGDPTWHIEFDDVRRRWEAEMRAERPACKRRRDEHQRLYGARISLAPGLRHSDATSYDGGTHGWSEESSFSSGDYL
eukprot:15475276-Alexandrium_andersonii.AAC.1